MSLTDRTEIGGRLHVLRRERHFFADSLLPFHSRMKCIQNYPSLPSIIFCIEQKVSGHDCHAHGHHRHNQKDEQHEPVDIVNLNE